MFIEKRTLIIVAIAVILIGGFFVLNPKESIAPDESVVTPVSNDAEGTADSPGETVETAPAAPKTTTATTPKAPTPAPKPAPAPAPQTGKLYKDFVQPTGFSNTNTLGLLNTAAFTLKQFVGEKVNALRVFPYTNMWHTKYKDKGLLIVSVHVPRFTFEQSKSIVDTTLYAHNVVHPVVLDNNYQTWNAYGNTVWPQRYLIDSNGYIVHQHSGEGAYGTTELKIQELLQARAQKLGLAKETYPTVTVPSDAVVIDLTRLKSPETYFGSARNSALGNATSFKDGTQDLTYPPLFIEHKPYLSGSWRFTKEYAMNLVTNASLRYTYEAKIVHGVFNAEKLTRVRVTRDGGALIPEMAGKDVFFEKGMSYFYVNGARIYEIVNDKAGYGTHTLELNIENSGLEVYTLTFG
jgi:hypothetical protein